MLVVMVVVVVVVVVGGVHKRISSRIVLHMGSTWIRTTQNFC